jgi:trimeric autotransporter adhesin
MRNPAKIVLPALVVYATGVAALPGLLSSVWASPGAAKAKVTEAPKALRSSSPTADFASLPAAAQSAISGTIGRDQSDYQAQPASNGGFGMVNSQGKLNVEFAQSGVAVHVGDTQGAGWGLALDGYGRGESMRLVSPAAPQANANRVDYHHGGLTEWYVNSPLGLEQGFTLAQPPERSSGQADQTLTIALSLSGDLAASVDSTGTGLTLKQHDGQAVLRYTGLSAQDAAGKSLKCWLELQGDKLLVRIDDAGARYPIIVDPWMQAAQLTNSAGAAGDTLGRSVAVDAGGDTVVVGGSLASTQGAAYVFVEPMGGWANISTPVVLTASDGVAGDAFGLSVGISGSGSTIVVGAPLATVGSNVDQGAAYVFVKPTSGGWATTSTSVAKLTASDGAALNEFAWGLAIDEGGDTIVAGAFNATVGSHADQGAAYVFVEPTVSGVTSWSLEPSPPTAPTYTAKLTASDGAADDAFGYAVGINESGNTIVAGAFQAMIGSNEYQGAAYVFVEPTTGGWVTPGTSPSYASKLTASDGTAKTYLGWSVGISLNTIVAAGFQNASAYVFVEPTTGGWPAAMTDTAELTPDGGAMLNEYGSAVGISGGGNTVVVGAPLVTVGSNAGQGAAYVFVAPSSGWATTSTVTAELNATGGAAESELGYGVGISGTTIVAGAPNAAIVSNTQLGAAYVFTSTAVAALYSNAGPIQFGAVQVNTTATQTLTLTNPATNSSPFMVTGVSLQGSDAAYFSISSVVCNGNTVAPANYASFSVTLNPNGTDVCTFTLQFLPTVNENGYSELLVVATNATSSNAAVGPGGAGTGQAILLLGDGVEPYAEYTNSTSGSPTQVSFGNVVENTTATQTVTVANTGDGPLVVQLADVAPGQGFSYSQVVCNSVMETAPLPSPFTVSAGVSCVFTVQFEPKALGPLGGALELLDNAAVGESNLTSTADAAYFTQTVSFTGTGISSIATTTTVTSTSSSFLGLALPTGYALVGNPITVNFSVQPVSGSLAPTGTVIVEDGNNEVCNPTGTLTSANGGKSSCPLTINVLGTGSTPVSATYTPDAASTSAGLLGSATTQPQFVENLVQIANCGTPPSLQSATQGMTTTYTFTVCLAGDVNAAVAAVVSSGCPAAAQCGATVTAVQGQPGVYSVVVTITTSSAVPPGNRHPLSGPAPLMLFALGLVLAMLLALRFAPQNRPRRRLAYAAGLLIALALLLGNINGCSSSSTAAPGTATGMYTISVKISAGAFSVTVPLTLNVT